MGVDTTDRRAAERAYYYREDYRRSHRLIRRGGVGPGGLRESVRGATRRRARHSFALYRIETAVVSLVVRGIVVLIVLLLIPVTRAAVVETTVQLAAPAIGRAAWDVGTSPKTLEYLWNLGRPTAYGCPTALPAAPPQQIPTTGVAGIAGAAGSALATANGPAPTRSTLSRWILARVTDTGRAWRAFTAAARTGKAPTTVDPGTIPDATGRTGQDYGYSGTVPVMPGAYGDTPAMKAARADIAAGWPAALLPQAVAVEGAESSWDPTAANPSGTARGLMQIELSVNAGLLGGKPWTDPIASAHAGWLLYQQRGWQPWDASRSMWSQFAARAAEAVARVHGIAGPYGTALEPAADPLAVPSGCGTAGGIVSTGYLTPSSNRTVEAAVAFALAQQGKPYLYGAAPMTAPGGIVPSAYDCSSLIQSAYAAAGVILPGRVTTTTLLGLGLAVPPSAVQRGDAILTSPEHVVLALGGGMVVEAAHTGTLVRVRAISPAEIWQVRRLAPLNPRTA